MVISFILIQFNSLHFFFSTTDQNEQKTAAVLTNGLNPIWNHLMQFTICIPELCLVRFSVKDSDKSNTDLGQYAIPFLSMQHGRKKNATQNFIRTISSFLFVGYRHISLLDGYNDPTTATLFVYVKVINMESTN